MNYIRCGMAQAKLTRIALRLRRESSINNSCLLFNVNVQLHQGCVKTFLLNLTYSYIKDDVGFVLGGMW